MALSKSGLAKFLTVEITGGVEITGSFPPELAVVLALAAALPEGEYVVHDDEGNGPPIPEEVADLALQGTAVASWDGTLPEAMGYGDARLLSLGKGTGLYVTLAGSSMQSASALAVLPA